jgi:chloramphenicol-sensitive protein RarD
VSEDPKGDGRRAGFLAGTGAFVAWGLIPIYWKALAYIPPLELLCHRVLWSTVFLAAILSVTRGWPQLGRSLTGKSSRLLAVSGVLIGGNWGLFIWAINSGRVLEASLAYYINPLAVALIGYFAFSERLRRVQILSLLLAGAGVANLAVSFGRLPWVALVLAVSFAVYGAVRKRAKVPVVDGLFLETVLLFPAALAFLLWRGEAARLPETIPSALLLAGSGVVTSVPLLGFAFGVRRLTLTTMGLLQFIAPTITFVLGVFVYREPFSSRHLLTFALIWLGVLAYASEAWWVGKSRILPGALPR